MGASSSSLTLNDLAENRKKLSSDLKDQCENILKTNNDNRAAKYALSYIDSKEANALSDEGKS